MFGLFSSNNEYIKNHATFQGKVKELSLVWEEINKYIPISYITAIAVILLPFLQRWFIPGISEFSTVETNQFQFKAANVVGGESTRLY